MLSKKDATRRNILALTVDIDFLQVHMLPLQSADLLDAHPCSNRDECNLALWVLHHLQHCPRLSYGQILLARPTDLGRFHAANRIVVRKQAFPLGMRDDYTENVPDMLHCLGRISLTERRRDKISHMLFP